MSSGGDRLVITPHYPETHHDRQQYRVYSHQLNSEHTQPHASDARTPSMSLDLQRLFDAPLFASQAQPLFFFVLPFFARRPLDESADGAALRLTRRSPRFLKGRICPLNESKWALRR